MAGIAGISRPSVHANYQSCATHAPRALLRRSRWLAGYSSKADWLSGCSQVAQLCHSVRNQPFTRTPAGAAVAALRQLHPASKAHKRGTLRVSHLHTLAYEVHGNPAGQPVLCVHGGPGAGAWANHARFFDPRHWRVVLVDQRACGGSTPRGCLTDNTTQALIQDFELLRKHLGIDTWVLFGGSWGTALSLAYAQVHTDRVDGLILRAICLMSPPEIDWMYRGGVAALQPKAWADFLAPLPEPERADPLAAYHKRLTSSDAATCKAAAAAWLQFDMAAGKVPSQQLQSWNGAAWAQNETGAGPAHHLPPLSRTASSGGGGSSASGSRTNGNGAAAAAPTSDQPATAAGGRAGSTAVARAARPPWQPQPGFGAGGDGSSAAGKSGASSPSPNQSTAQQKHGSKTSRAGSSSANGSSSGNDNGGAGKDASSAGSAAGQAASGGMSHFEAQARLEAHYCVNGAFLLDRPILEDVERLRGIPAIGIQGRLDLVCPPVAAFRLHKAWPELRLRLVGGAGHSQYDPAIQHELLEATDAMRNRAWVPPSPQLQVAVY